MQRGLQMNRMLVVGFAVLLFGGMAWVHSAQDAKEDSDNVTVKVQVKAPAVAKKDAAKPLSVAEKLAKRFNFDGMDDPKTTLQAALDHLSEKMDLHFDVEEYAFKAALADQSVLAVPVATTPMHVKRNLNRCTCIRKI